MANKIPEGVNPLSTIVPDGGMTAIFRTIAFIGDSLSSGEHESLDENGKKGYHDYYEYSWGQFIARKCGLTAFNYSIGGLTAREFHSLADHTKCFTPEKACQAYVIALGVNDSNRVLDGTIEFGSMDDVDFDDWLKNKNTFVGDYVRIIQRIKQVQPKARIFCLTMPKKEDVTTDSQKMMEKMSEFIRSLEDVFEFTYCVDLRKYGEVYDDAWGKKYLLGGHLSAIGYKYTADVVATYIDFIINNNIDDFKQVGFIGKAVHNCGERW